MATLAEAMAGIQDGSRILLAGFGAGTPELLMRGLIEQGVVPVRDLLYTPVCCNRRLIMSLLCSVAAPVCASALGIWAGRRKITGARSEASLTENRIPSSL